MPSLAVDHIIVAATDLEAAGGPFERLGLRLTPATGRADGATVNRAFLIGDGGVEFYVELLAVADATAAEAASRTRSLRAALKDGRAGFAIGLSTDEMGPVRTAFAACAAEVVESQPQREDGSVLCDLLQPVDDGLLGCAVSILRYDEPREARYRRHEAAGQFRHDFPLVRLDHLAIVVHDLPVARAWEEILDAPATGTISGPGFVAKQVRLTGGTVELLSASAADGLMAGRPPGMSSMAAFEVADLDSAVALARSRGFTVPDGRPGAIPGTRTATISADQLSGLNLQLLQYV